MPHVTANPAVPSNLGVWADRTERHCHVAARECWELLAGKCGYRVVSVGRRPERRSNLAAVAADGALVGDYSRDAGYGWLAHPRGLAW